MDYVKIFLNSVPVLVIVVLWAIHLEVKISKIETDITWIKKELPACRQPSVKHIH